MEYYNYYDFFVGFLIPLTLIITLNTVTAFAVWKPSKVGRTVKSYNSYNRYGIKVTTKFIFLRFLLEIVFVVVCFFVSSVNFCELPISELCFFFWKVINMYSNQNH